MVRRRGHRLFAIRRHHRLGAVRFHWLCASRRHHHRLLHRLLVLVVHGLTAIRGHLVHLHVRLAVGGLGDSVARLRLGDSVARLRLAVGGLSLAVDGLSLAVEEGSSANVARLSGRVGDLNGRPLVPVIVIVVLVNALIFLMLGPSS